ncbi:hypothetical protein CDL12_24312 [Handroanthus impetiginosus]|uniref:Uncharacterized protein n=1 Tax=Handroanthus impetiginosus TaxID=429701 RepID=A0A2G9GD93_9LAMI|nr:hypothetical protein CDL12_24312 [Handroanthus impetiginosus]
MTRNHHNAEKCSSTKTRPLGNMELSWTRAVSCGTGTTVLALQMAKPISEVPLLHEILLKLQKAHPLLRSKLHYDPTRNTFSFLTSPTPKIDIKIHNLQSTSNLLKILSSKQTSDVSPCHLILEHELNSKFWCDPKSFPCNGIEVLFASVYALSDTKSIVMLRLHVSMCDRTTAVSLLRELLELVEESEGGRVRSGIKNDGEGNMGIENMIPSGMGKKTLWAHGVDMLGYSVNSLRLTNLKFENTKLPRSSEVVRLQMDTQRTSRILAIYDKTKSSQIHISSEFIKPLMKLFINKCSVPNFSGFYHSAILNIHTLNGTENFWDLAKRIHTDFTYYKTRNKHFSDMADLNFLMNKDLENPSLTASSSLRTSLISVFEDPVIDNTKQMQREIGVEDYLGCASIHGVGPSIAVFDTIRDGELDCACVYPAPLHSREQINEVVGHMRRILIDGSS